MTQSLLFEMEEWERLDSIGYAANLLVLPGNTALGSEPKQLKLHYVPITAPNDPEIIFLRKSSSSTIESLYFCLIRNMLSP